jgi:regulator of sigma E protease
MFSVLIFFLILSVLVLVHELGHFIAAKKNGVYVQEFGVGLPPRIFEIKYGETLYSLNLLPFGGFVKVYGETEEQIKGEKEKRKRAFVYKEPWQKTLIIAAGVAANFLLGWIILSYLFTQGIPVPTNKVVIEKIIKNSPADIVGLQSNDIIESVVNPNLKLKSPEDLVNLTKKYSSQEITLLISRKNQQIYTKIIPRKKPPKGEGPLGIVITSFIEKKYPWQQAPIYGLIESVKITISIIKELVKNLYYFLTFHKTEVGVTGPVGIAQITFQAVKLGKNAVLQVLGLLSLNLAVVNIFPFPALDGGRLALVAYEAIFKKKTNPKIEKYLNLVGFAILLSLIMLITINDVLKLFQ